MEESGSEHQVPESDSERPQARQVSRHVQNRQPEHPGHQEPQGRIYGGLSPVAQRQKSDEGRHRQNGEDRQVPPPGYGERLASISESESDQEDANDESACRGDQRQVGQTFRPQGGAGQTGEQVVHTSGQAQHQPAEHQCDHRHRAQTAGRDREQRRETHCGYRRQPQHRPEPEEGGGGKKVSGGGAVPPGFGRHEGFQPAGRLAFGLSCAATCYRGGCHQCIPNSLRAVRSVGSIGAVSRRKGTRVPRPRRTERQSILV